MVDAKRGFKETISGTHGRLSQLGVCFGSGHDLRVLGSSPASGSLLRGESPLPLYLPLPLLVLSPALSFK